MIDVDFQHFGSPKGDRASVSVHLVVVGLPLIETVMFGAEFRRIEVGNLEPQSIFGNQDVVRLQVSMDDSVLMQELNSLNKLFEKFSSLSLRALSFLLDEVEHFRPLEILHDQKSVTLFVEEQVFNPNDVCVAQPLHVLVLGINVLQQFFVPVFNYLHREQLPIRSFSAPLDYSLHSLFTSPPLLSLPPRIAPQILTESIDCGLHFLF